MEGWGSRRVKGPRYRTASVIYIALLIAISSITVLASNDANADHPTTTGRIIVISNETAIPIAIGTPSTGLDPFTGLLQNHVGVYITGQVVDGNYTPIWQPGSSNNNGIGGSYVHWSFGEEPDRAHSVPTDGDGLFSFFLTPDGTAPTTVKFRFWFDGKSDSIFGIPIYPPAEIVYDVKLAEANHLTIEPGQYKAMAGDTVLVTGTFKEMDGNPIVNEGLMAFFDGQPAQENPHDGWYIDDIVLGPYSEDFEAGMEGFVTGGKGSSWSAGLPGAGPKGGHNSLGAAGTALDDSYEYATDSWMMGPAVDLSSYDQAYLTFSSWADVPADDRIMIELSNDDGLTWPVAIDVPASTSWIERQYTIGRFLDTPYGEVDFGHKENVRVRFRLVSNTLPLMTDEDGAYEFLLEIPEDMAPGPATILVEHPGSSRYIRTTSTVDIKVARSTIIETVGPDTIYNGVPVEIRARLVDHDGTLLETWFPGESVPTPHVKVWLRQGMTETYLGDDDVDRYGYMALGEQFARTNPLGPAELVFKFRGNEYYSPSETTREVVFKAHTETTILSPNDASLMTSDKIEIEGTVHVVRSESVNDVTRDPVARRDVNIHLNDKDIGTVTTDDEGRFTLIHTVGGSGESLGNAAITARFIGDLVYEPSEDVVDFSILSTTSVQLPSKAIKKGSIAIIDGTLSSMEGGLHGIIDIEVGGQHFTKVVTGPTGKFVATYNVPWDIEIGDLPVTVRYLGNDVYKSCMATVMYKVEADTVILVEDGPIEAYRGNSITLRGTLVDTWDGAIGPPVTGRLVELTLPDGTKAQALTGLNGKFNHYYQLPKDLSIGSTEAIATYTDENRGPSTATIPIHVKSQTSLAFLQLDDDVLSGHYTAVKVALTDDSGGPVQGEVVQIFLVDDGREIPLFKGPTDSAGTVAFTTSFNATGSLTLVARYDGAGYLEPSERYSYTMSKTAPVKRPPLREQPTVVLGGGLLTILVLALVGTESGKYFLIKLLLVPMYTKLKKTDVLDHFVRGQIFGLIRMQPGAHYNLIKKRLDLKNGVLSYHLATLEREGYILSEIDGIYKRFFPNHVKFEADFPMFLSKIQERILDLIRSTPGTTQKDVANELGVSTSTVNDNIKVLKQAKLIELKRDGKRTRCFAMEE